MASCATFWRSGWQAARLSSERLLNVGIAHLAGWEASLQKREETRVVPAHAVRHSVEQHVDHDHVQDGDHHEGRVDLEGVREGADDRDDRVREAAVASVFRRWL